MSNNYDPLPQEEPIDQPPAYTPPVDVFEIEEPFENASLSVKAQRFAANVSLRMHSVLDPVYQLYCYSNAKFEHYIGKLGNPLFVRRLLYVALIAIVLYLVSLSGITTDSVVTTHTDFTDLSKLDEFIRLSVDSARLEENLQYLSSMPRLSGTAGDLALSNYFKDVIDSSVLQINKDISFYSYANYPLNPKVQLIEKANILHECDLKEHIEGDEDKYHTLAYNPGSKSGDAVGILLYVNYGTIEDYRYLSEQLIEIKDKIVLIKYGGSLPAYTKLRYAQERGAKGVLFISDPKQQNVYNMESIQREPVAFQDILPGDILNPGYAAGLDYNGIVSMPFEQSSVAPSIPSMPIKWKDFVKIMGMLKGKGLRMQNWDVTLDNNNVEIWTGANYEISIQNQVTERPLKESWNVNGKLFGREQDYLAIVIGASRDSVCYGALEASGSAILAELINVFSEMAQSLHWRPLRSIFFVSYSGTKFNNAGPTRFFMEQQEFFKRDVYAYIDLDDIIQGNKLEVTGDPLFASLLAESVDVLFRESINNTEIGYSSSEIKYNIDPYSNSYPAVIHHGVGNAMFRLVDEKQESMPMPQYAKNSCFDNFSNFKNKNIDPEMEKHAFMTKLISSYIVRQAETPIIPYDVHALYTDWDRELRNINTHLKSLQESNNDSKLHSIKFDAFLDSMLHMKQVSDQHRAFVTTWKDISGDGSGAEPNLLSLNRWNWNSRMVSFFKMLLSPQGRYGKPWDYNLFYGREFNPSTDKVHTILPGIWDAIGRGDWDGVNQEIVHIAETIEQAVALFQY